VSLRTILEEIAESIESKFIETKFYDSFALIKLGRIEETHRHTDISWRIEPNSDVRLHAEAGESLFVTEPGFKVEETAYYIEDVSDNITIFPNEQAVSEYLIKEITEKVAHYRHLESLAEKRKKNN